MSLKQLFVKAHFYVLPLTGVCISPSMYHFIPHVSFQAEMFWIYMKKKLYLLGLGTTEMLLSCTSWRHLSTTLPMSTTNFPYPIFYFIHSLFCSFLGNPSCRVDCTARKLYNENYKDYLRISYLHDKAICSSIHVQLYVPFEN